MCTKEVRGDSSLISITVEFIGSLKTLANTKKCTMELEDQARVSTLIQKLKTELFTGQDFADQSSLLITVNGKEVSALNGLHTELKNRDAVKLIPASHGG